MSHYITDACIGTKDTACVEVCPVDCIHPRKDEPQFAAEKMLYINPAECIDCGLCVEECPVRAIYHEDNLPPDQQRFVQINTDFFAGRGKTGA